MAQFIEGDVVRFVEGSRLMNLWGDRVHIGGEDDPVMFVVGQDAEDVKVNCYPYTFTWKAEELVKVGHSSDTHYVDGDEVETWFPELYEDEDGD